MTVAEIAAKMTISDSELWSHLVSDVEMKAFHLGALSGNRKSFERASREGFIIRSFDTTVSVKRGIGKVTWHKGRTVGPGLQNQYSEGFLEIVSGAFVLDGVAFASIEDSADYLMGLLI
jgi:hypothetical protein